MLAAIATIATEANPFGYQPATAHLPWWVSRYTIIAIFVAVSLVRSIWKSHIASVKQKAIAEHTGTLEASTMKAPTPVTDAAGSR
jgi:hypothetical protein